ncbi:amino acid permease 5-like [Arachis duranensis]|uniref:Amino acid permease 5-like n=1 Tax=Arachis duranensis TaxID=130453 RepID=A0A6P5NAU5_ARADU|nr:amino acid permease 5-like [Arachis duranensis]
MTIAILTWLPPPPSPSCWYISGISVFCQPLFAFVEKWCARKWAKDGFATIEYKIALPCIPTEIVPVSWRTVVFVFSTTIIDMLMPFFNDVVGILGAFGFWPLTVYFPIDMYISKRKIPRWSNRWLGLQLLSFTT